MIDDKYLFTGDTIWFGADGGYSFISALAESNKLAVRSLGILEQKLKKMCVKPLFITGHTGFTDNLNLHLHIRKSCVHRLKRKFMIRRHRTMPMMSLMIQRKMQKRNF